MTEEFTGGRLRYTFGVPLYQYLPLSNSRGYWDHQKEAVRRKLGAMLVDQLLKSRRPLMVGPISVRRERDWHAWQVAVDIPVKVVQYHEMHMAPPTVMVKFEPQNIYWPQ